MAKRVRKTFTPNELEHPFPSHLVQVEAEPVPALVLEAVNGLEAVTVGTLQVAKGLLVHVVGGVIDLGTVALTVAFTGARGVITVASTTARNIATTTKDTVEDTASSIRRID